VKEATGPASAPFPRRTALFAAALVALHLAGAYALDALGLIESLLSPSGARVLWLVPLAGLFYLVRFTLLFVAPGLALGALLLWLADRRG
jgi:hypothetical protein